MSRTLSFGSEAPKPGMVRASFSTALIAAGAFALAGPAAAQADTVVSSNWAGYAVHRSGVHYTRVIGAWKQPSGSCRAGQPSYSATWVGLGGYSETSAALEQIGTEVDCSRSGRAVSSAWYELVPAASHTISLRVRPGDALVAEVTVVGRRVGLVLNDKTTHTSFHKTLQAGSVEVSSAEWIEEAPSECFSAADCQTLPLADFGAVRFGLARAQASSGHVGAIADSAWNRTRISLVASGRRFVANSSRGATEGEATASRLTANGTSFAVTYSSVAVQPGPLAAPDASAPGYIVHGRAA